MLAFERHSRGETDLAELAPKSKFAPRSSARRFGVSMMWPATGTS